MSHRKLIGLGWVTDMKDTGKKKRQINGYYKNDDGDNNKHLNKKQHIHLKMLKMLTKVVKLNYELKENGITELGMYIKWTL